MHHPLDVVRPRGPEDVCTPSIESTVPGPRAHPACPTWAPAIPVIPERRRRLSGTHEHDLETKRPTLNVEVLGSGLAPARPGMSMSERLRRDRFKLG